MVLKCNCSNPNDYPFFTNIKPCDQDQLDCVNIVANEYLETENNSKISTFQIISYLKLG